VAGGGRSGRAISTATAAYAQTISAATYGPLSDVQSSAQKMAAQAAARRCAYTMRAGANMTPAPTHRAGGAGSSAPPNTPKTSRKTATPVAGTSPSTRSRRRMPPWSAKTGARDGGMNQPIPNKPIHVSAGDP